jgi:hypothetical protein
VLGSLMERRPFAVLGALNVYPPPVAVDRVLHTCKTPASKFTSSHLRANTSPCLIPVVMASTYSASRLSSLAALSRARACSGERGLISLLLLRRRHCLRYVAGIRPSITACFKALWRVTWINCTMRGASPALSLTL